MPITNAKYKGRDFVLKIETSPGVFTQIGGLTATGLTINNETVDITDKDDDTWRKLLEGAGVRSISLSASGWWNNQAAFDVLRDSAFAGTIKNYEVLFGNGDKIGGAYQANLDGSGAHNDPQQYSVTLESANTQTLTNVA